MEPPFDPPPPEDVVPRRGLDADTIQMLDAAQGQQIEITIPGNVLTDPDGVPIGVEAPTVATGSLAGVTIARADLAATGLTPQEVPNVRITDH